MFCGHARTAPPSVIMLAPPGPQGCGGLLPVNWLQISFHIGFSAWLLLNFVGRAQFAGWIFQLLAVCPCSLGLVALSEPWLSPATRFSSRLHEGQCCAGPTHVGGAFPPSCGCQILAVEAHCWVLAPLPTAKPHHGPRGMLTAHPHGSDFLFLVLEYTPFLLLSLAMYFQLYFIVTEKRTFAYFLSLLTEFLQSLKSKVPTSLGFLG